MCITSMIGDGWREQFPFRWPNTTINTSSYSSVSSYDFSSVTRTEFETLKKEMQELKELLKAAKRFDEATGQPNCEEGEKVRLIKDIAKAVGVNMDEVFNCKP